MPLTLIRARTSERLWNALVRVVLDGDAHVWLTHRNHRDRLFEAARERGVEGWLDPPLTFMSDLSDRFGVATRPAGLLTRRRLLGRLAAERGRGLGVGVGEGRHALARGHMLDPLLGELLAGGVEPRELRFALAAVADDDFAARRNAWVESVYGAYRDALRERQLHDPRQLPALVAREVERGRLPGVVGGASTLHVWGLHALGTWGRLVRALARQEEVEVVLYLPFEDEPDPEWGALRAGERVLDEADDRPPAPDVQPAPDARRELRWVASQVKAFLTGGGARPWEVAVVARTGEDDVRRAWAALREAGVPATARIRTPLAEIAALKALLELLLGAAMDWPYRTLRNVLGSPYLDVRVDLRFIDLAAGRARLHGLDAWAAELEKEEARLARAAEARESEGLQAMAERATECREAFDRFRKAVAPLSAARSEEAWIRATLDLMAGQGLFHFRQRLSKDVDGRWEVVRLDQRGVLQLEALLREWGDLDLDPHPLEPSAWHDLLRRLLEGHQLALTTPLQKGVQVLEAHDAALTPFRRVWVVHANDGVFPRPPSGGGVLTEGERTRLAERGLLPVADRARGLRRERTLWRAVTAGDGVTLSYRTTDPAGTPLLPSLMVPDHDPGKELARDWEPPRAVDPEQHQRELADLLAEPDGGLVASPDPEPLRRAVLAAHAEDARDSLERQSDPTRVVPTPWAGWIRDPAALALLGERYGDDHVWSASQLESYARCPFLFFMERVLRLEDVAEAGEETDLLTFGGVAHRLLEGFWNAMKDAPPDAWDLRVETEYARVRDAVKAGLEREGTWTGLPVLWRETWEDVSDAVRAYLAKELPALAKKGERTELVEHAFGRGPEAGEPVLLEGRDREGRPVRLRLAGRIDRVDRLGDGGRAILDYKTSRTPAGKSYLDGVTLQSALYMRALQAELGGRVTRAGYRSIKSPGQGTRGDIEWGSTEFETSLALAFSIPPGYGPACSSPSRRPRHSGRATTPSGTSAAHGAPSPAAPAGTARLPRRPRTHPRPRATGAPREWHALDPGAEGSAGRRRRHPPGGQRRHGQDHHRGGEDPPAPRGGPGRGGGALHDTVRPPPDRRHHLHREGGLRPQAEAPLRDRGVGQGRGAPLGRGPGLHRHHPCLLRLAPPGARAAPGHRPYLPGTGRAGDHGAPPGHRPGGGARGPRGPGRGGGGAVPRHGVGGLRAPGGAARDGGAGAGRPGLAPGAVGGVARRRGPARPGAPGGAMRRLDGRLR